MHRNYINLGCSGVFSNNSNSLLICYTDLCLLGDLHPRGNTGCYGHTRWHTQWHTVYGLWDGHMSTSYIDIKRKTFDTSSYPRNTSSTLSQN